LLDELDQLASRKQSLIYNFFDWPNRINSRLIVVAISNTMDLPERMLSAKIVSRLDRIRITFPDYTYDQLEKIMRSRLKDQAKLFEADTLVMLSRKVASTGGDCRRALDICR
jgi:origin recognition complex subunit 1